MRVNEPPHIHIETPEGECKFWLDPIKIARNKGVLAPMLRTIERLIFENIELIKEKYNAYFE